MRPIISTIIKDLKKGNLKGAEIGVGSHLNIINCKTINKVKNIYDWNFRKDED